MGSCTYFFIIMGSVFLVWYNCKQHNVFVSAIIGKGERVIMIIRLDTKTVLIVVGVCYGIAVVMNVIGTLAERRSR